MALGYHVMIRLRDDRVIAPTANERLILACVVLKAARHSRLIAFGTADNHLHSETAGDERAAGELARRIEIGLHHRLRLTVRFERVRLKAIADQRHLASTFRYALSQERHHGTAIDPLFVATNLPDLLGLRLLGGYTREHLRSFLPRVSRAELCDLLAAPNLDHAVLDPQQSLVDLADAAAAAFGLPAVTGNRRAACEARRAAAHCARPWASVAAIAEALAIDERSAYRLLQTAPPPEALRAIELQLKLRAVRRAQGRVPTRP